MPAVWSSPLCLIKSNSNNQLEIVESTAEKLSLVVSQLPVVGITGDARTGKSYLQNWLARNINPEVPTGFPSSSSVDSCTKGIWVWLIGHPTEKGQSVLLMDTEGLGDVQKGDSDYDQWIFALTVLLSNVLIYNNLGAINNDALEKLHMAIAEDVMGKSQADNQSPNQGKCFVWAARDVSLELVKDGEDISPDEYLEWSLKKSRGKSIGLCEFLRSHFPERKCFTFPFPTTDSRILGNLKDARDDQIDECFKAVARAFFDYINLKRQELHEGQLSGRGFVCLVREYLDAIKNGSILSAKSVLQTVTERENNRAVEESLKRFNERMEAVKLPTYSSETLSAISQKSSNQAFDVFRQIAIFDSEEKFKLLKAEIDTARKRWRAKNVAASREACLAKLAKLSRRLDKQRYMVVGGYAAYSADLQQVVDSYKASGALLGVMREECLEQFLRDRTRQKDLIKTNDEKLKKLEEERQEEHRRAEAMRREEQRAREEKERAEQRMRILREQEEQQRRENWFLAGRVAVTVISWFW